MEHKCLILLLIVIVVFETCSSSDGSREKYDRKKGVLDWVSNAWNGFKRTVSNGWKKTKSVVSITLDKVKSGTKSAWTGMKKVGKKAVCTVIKRLKFCGRTPKTPEDNNIPPGIRCPTVPSRYYAEKGENKVKVNWNEPTSSGTIKHMSGPRPGRYLAAGDYVVTYVATRYGLTSDPCVLRFAVIAYTCEYPSSPSNGRVKCHHNPPRYGDRCWLECADGYKPGGSSRRTCQKNQEFDGGNFYCEPIVCDEPIVPENAYSTCTEDDYTHNSLCVFNCEEGFGRSDDIIMSECSSTGTWYPSVTSDCKDNVPPRIDGCPSSFVAYVGLDGKHAIVNYTMPTAKDDVDGPLNVTLEEGFLPGQQVAINREAPAMNAHIVKLSASDSSGTKSAPCQFQVIVADLMCDPLENKPLLIANCTEPLYTLGSSCSFSCVSGNLPDGADSAICRKHEDRDEAYWDWSDDMMPECSNKECPDLKPPGNGSIGCVTILGSLKECVMACNEKYDIPQTVAIDGIFFCDPDFGWTENDKVYDCTEIRRGDRYTLGVDFYYYGDCSSSEVQGKIKDHVINTILSTKYKTVCEKDEDCTVDNVAVSCATGRKKASNTWAVSFDLVVQYVFDSNIPIYDQHKALENGVYDRYDLLKSDMEDGLLDIDGAVADPASLAHGFDAVDCPPGMKPRSYSLSCSACPTGTRYDGIQDTCVDCPVGTYQDREGQFSCQSCPTGFSTFFTASTNLKDCKEFCPSGSASSSGFIPCYLCNVGTYQERTGQTTCTQCPSGSNSTIQGSSSLLDCKSDNVVCSSSAICGEHGICLPDYDTEEDYQCICRDGYTGDDCSTAPSPCYFHTCRNDAECVPLENNYTCNCKSDYTGKYCQHKIVDGGWSPFESWSGCTKTCGTGTQIRYRDCSLPYPQYGGLDCVGYDFEIRECNTDPCPACPYAQRPYKGFVNVTDEDDVLTATIYCSDGYVLSDATIDTFTCGHNTSYVWHPVKTSKEFPKCTAFRSASTITTTSRTVYPNLPDSGQLTLDALTTKTAAVLATNPCVAAGDCTQTVRTEVVVSPVKRDTREKRETSFTIIVISVINSTMDSSDYFVDGEINEEAVFSALPQYMATMIVMEDSMDVLENYTRDGSLGIEINGQFYFPDPESFTVSGTLGCPPGTYALDGLCVNCPPGTKGVNGTCVECEVGTYQDEEAQLECIACPDGLTTEYGGCVNSDLCYSLPSESPIPDSTNDPNDGVATAADTEIHGKSDNLIYLAVLAVIPIMITIILIWCYCKKVKEVNTPKENPGEGVNDVKEPEGGIPDGYKYYYMKSMNNLNGAVIMSAPPKAYEFRPATVSDVMVEDL